MRIVKEINDQDYKCTIFSWNGKYLIKWETPFFEQTYKIPELELSSEEDLDHFLSEQFQPGVEKVFAQMHENFGAVLKKL